MLTFALVWLADRYAPTTWAQRPMAGVLSSAQAVAPAIRHSTNEPPKVSAMADAVPASIRTETHKSAIRFNNCTGNIIRDDHGAVLGFVGAAHCVRTASNSIRNGVAFAGATSSPIDRSAILLDTTTDVFYSGLEGHHAIDVWRQVWTNYTRADIDALPSTTMLAMSGYPSHHNPRGELVTLSLTLGGIVHWPNDPTDTIATFGDWNALEQTCSPGASGSGLYHYVEGAGWVVIAVLASRAEFEGVQTMPYSPEYGLELRSFFEKQLDLTIDAEYMCGFAPPSLPPRTRASTTFPATTTAIVGQRTSLRTDLSV
ncbi:MAG: hypothetical protein ABJ382_21685 [Ilumatobacter sp.]|uniref:hypothetical protein n=1 Tax=Ilumatobacter sp. TaxID=1967498 RepID=UPI00329A0159